MIYTIYCSILCIMYSFPCSSFRFCSTE